MYKIWRNTSLIIQLETVNWGSHYWVDIICKYAQPQTLSQDTCFSELPEFSWIQCFLCQYSCDVLTDKLVSSLTNKCEHLQAQAESSETLGNNVLLLCRALLRREPVYRRRVWETEGFLPGFLPSSQQLRTLWVTFSSACTLTSLTLLFELIARSSVQQHK